MKTNSEIIKEAYDVLGCNATNKEIRNYAEEKYGTNIKSNLIWNVIGNQRQRQLQDLTVLELIELQQFVGKFDGGITRLRKALSLYDRTAALLK